MDKFYDGFDQEITPTDVTDTDGNIKISSDVVSTIAAIAATETPGVAEMYTSIPGAIAEKLGARKNPSKGVKVEIADNNVVVDLYIVIKYGFKIRRVSESVQESVKNNIETMTGLTVSSVNIHVEGVTFESKITDDMTVEIIDDITE